MKRLLFVATSAALLFAGAAQASPSYLPVAQGFHVGDQILCISAPTKPGPIADVLQCEVHGAVYEGHLQTLCSHRADGGHWYGFVLHRDGAAQILCHPSFTSHATTTTWGVSELKHPWTHWGFACKPTQAHNAMAAECTAPNGQHGFTIGTHIDHLW